MNKADNYRFISQFYDRLAHVYSRGRILASKQYQNRYFMAGQRVLFAGAGTGEDCLEAAERGVQLTLIDSSLSMLQAARARLAKQDFSEDAEIFVADVMDHHRSAYYDVVVANYFLNIFSSKEMPGVFAHLASLVKPGGLLLVTDFSPAAGRGLRWLWQQFYWYFALFCFRFFAANAWHGIHDYVAVLPADFSMIVRQDFGENGPHFCCYVFQRALGDLQPNTPSKL